ncbi:MAG: hypothetical protein JWP07_1836, partial [Pseudonocardiales bacterium]|nr:hypothetical protein [Pseudonocardiales bacterium]
MGAADVICWLGATRSSACFGVTGSADREGTGALWSFVGCCGTLMWIGV